MGDRRDVRHSLGSGFGGSSTRSCVPGTIRGAPDESVNASKQQSTTTKGGGMDTFNCGGTRMSALNSSYVSTPAATTRPLPLMQEKRGCTPSSHSNILFNSGRSFAPAPQIRCLAKFG